MGRFVTSVAVSFALSASALGNVTPASGPRPALMYDVDQLWGFRGMETAPILAEASGPGVEGLIAPFETGETLAGSGVHRRYSRLVLAVQRGFTVELEGGAFGDVVDGGLSPIVVPIGGPQRETSLTLVPMPLSAAMGVAGLCGVGLMGRLRRRTRTASGAGLGDAALANR